MAHIPMTEKSLCPSWMSVVASTTPLTWKELSWGEAFLKVISFGLYSPHMSLSDKFHGREVMENFYPSSMQDNMDGEFARAEINGSSIRLCLDSNNTCTVIHHEGDKSKSTKLSFKDYNNLLCSLPSKQFHLGSNHILTAPVVGSFEHSEPPSLLIDIATNCCTSVISDNDFFPVDESDFNSVWRDVYRDVSASNKNSTKIYINNDLEMSPTLLKALINSLGIDQNIDAKTEIRPLKQKQAEDLVNSIIPRGDNSAQLYISLFQKQGFIAALMSAFWQSLHITSSAVENKYSEIMEENVVNRLNLMPDKIIANHYGHVIRINSCEEKYDVMGNKIEYEVSASILPSHVTCNGLGINKIETVYGVPAGVRISSEGFRNAIPPESRQVSFAIITPEN
ncbi:TPA: EspG domain-containing protein [Escherichia coli]|uniref:EspG domain-containing protein n=1 Tax=Escherichia coli TaxID=562 RepID=UPI0037A10B2A